MTEVLSGCVRGTTGTVAGDCALTSTERGPPTARRARGAHDGYGVPASGAEPSPGTDRRQCPGAASAAAVSREPQHWAPGRPGDGLGGGTGSGWFPPNGAAPKRRGLTPQLCAYDRRLDKRTLIEGGSGRVSRGGAGGAEAASTWEVVRRDVASWRSSHASISGDRTRETACGPV